MAKPLILWNSLKTRLTLGSLAIFLASLWSLSFHASSTLRADMERLLGEQQFTTVSLVADRVEHEFADRIEWLTEAARQTEKAMLKGPEAVQSQLEGWKTLFSKFNGGTFVARADGTAIAALPRDSGRIGVNYMDRDYIIAALRESRVAIGSPVMGRTSQTPVIVVAVPLHGAQGETIGALTGVINMAETNFLDLATQSHYGRTGGFLLVVPQKRMIATATDKTRVMEIMPVGVNPLLDRFIQGYEGYGVTVNTLGTEILAAAKAVPVAGWYVSGYLPTGEAFEPIRRMERRMLNATLILTVLAGLFSWWMLRRQLAPLMSAAESLAGMSSLSRPAQPLAVLRDDEIGQLIGGFNRLLEALGQRESQLKQILDASSVAIFRVDWSWQIVQANQRMAEMFGYPVETLIGSDYNLLVAPEEQDAVKEALGEAVSSTDDSIDTDWLFCRADQSTFWGHLTVRRFVGVSGEELGLVGVIADITVRKEAEERNRLAASVFSHAREGITITAADGTIIDVNEAFTRITGYTRGDALGKTPRILRSNHHDTDFYAAMWRDLTGKGYWSGEIWNRRKNGELYPELLTISAVRDEHGGTLHYVGLFTDITPIKEQEEQLKRMAHFDLLTTLPNRVLLGDRLAQAMLQTQRRKQLLAVAYLDLDGFKAVNDTHGHKTGDQLLVALAARMRQALREGDTLARLGGDEFVAILIDLEQISDSLPMLNRLLGAAAQPVRVGERVLQVSASLGATFYPQNEDVDADQLLRQADQAMYHAKLAGKNRYQLFDADQDRTLRGRNESIEHVRRALAGNELVLHYQPKVNMRTGEVVGVEALIRWQHPQKGLLPPAAFLPTIDTHPLAVDVGEWVIATALDQVEQWRCAGLDVPVSVNVCPRLLQREGFPARLKQIIERQPAVQPQRLTLEVLESSALEDLAGVSRIIEECQALGVGFSLDDFGTGYSSLTYLKRLSVDQLKIDQSFVRGMLEDTDDLTILEGVISLAEAFRREVIAEGVETIAHGEMLLLLGCELAQGYGIARPMPAADLPAWVAAWRPEPLWQMLRPAKKQDLPLLFAATEHRAWFASVEKYLRRGGETLRPNALERCRFGMWLAGGQSIHHDGDPAFLAIRNLHAEMHALADVLCARKRNGEIDDIQAALKPLADLSGTLLVRLHSLVMEWQLEGALESHFEPQGESRPAGEYH